MQNILNIAWSDNCLLIYTHTTIYIYCHLQATNCIQFTGSIQWRSYLYSLTPRQRKLLINKLAATTFPHAISDWSIHEAPDWSIPDAGLMQCLSEIQGSGNIRACSQILITYNKLARNTANINLPVTIDSSDVYNTPKYEHATVNKTLFNPEKHAFSLHQKTAIMNVRQEFLNRYRIYQYNILIDYRSTFSGPQWYLNQKNRLHHSDKTMPSHSRPNTQYSYST